MSSARSHTKSLFESNGALMNMLQTSRMRGVQGQTGTLLVLHYSLVLLFAFAFIPKPT